LLPIEFLKNKGKVYVIHNIGTEKKEEGKENKEKKGRRKRKIEEKNL